jgi:hypothetical protein
MMQSTKYTLKLAAATPAETTTTSEIPLILTGKQLERTQYFQAFVDQQFDNLQHLYTIIFNSDLKQRISLTDWIHFAFHQTSTNGLQSYK